VASSLSNNLELEISFYVHATEDDGKILNALDKNFNLNKSLFEIIQLEGHYGNPILRYYSSINDDLAQKIFETIFKRLEPSQKQALLGTLEQYIDSSKSLYVRLDKPNLCEGRLTLGKANSVHFKFKPKKKYLMDALDFYRVLILSLV